ncbi:MAG TPA: LysR family transcriptional regulator [bacterium]|nr:LysR family transcriptional regulator [bacterium]
MELRHLRYFVAVAEERHVTRAAARLGIQQPPLSQQIRALEQELGAQLFHRQPRGVDLTDAGRALLVDARAILALVDRAAATVRQTAQGMRGRVAVGFTSSAPFHPFVPRVIRAFREACPDVSLTLEENGTADLVQGLRGGRIDAAFIRSPIADAPDLAVRPLLDEEMIVALPAAHRLAHAGGGDEAALPLRALAAETFILYRRPSGPGLYDAIISACRRAGFSPNIGQEAPLIVSTLNLVAAGLGVSIVPASLRRQHMDGVVYRRIKARLRPRAPINLAHRRDEHSPAVRRFIELVHRLRRTAGRARE